MRTSEFGSPFRNVGTGRPEDDSENASRYDIGLKNFIAQEKANGNFANYDTSMLETVQFKYGLYYGPLAGIIFGKFFSDAFVSAKARYLPKLICLFFAGWGYKYGNFAKSRANYRFATKNFPAFPKEVQEAFQTGDSRYLRKYWQTA